MNNRQKKDLDYEKHVLWSLQHEQHGVTKELPQVRERILMMEQRLEKLPGEILAQEQKIEMKKKRYGVTNKEDSKKRRMKKLRAELAKLEDLLASEEDAEGEQEETTS